MSRKKQTTEHIIALHKHGILRSRWDMSQHKPLLVYTEYLVTEVPFLAYGYINNLPRLAKLFEYFQATAGEADTYHILLALDHAQEQLIFNPPEQLPVQHDHDGLLLHTQQHLFATQDGTNAQLHTTIKVALLVQLQLLAASVGLTLQLVSTFSYACLYAYTKLHHQSYTRISTALSQDLRQAEYEYTKLCNPEQLLSYIQNATELHKLAVISPAHVTASVATALFLSEHTAHGHKKYRTT